MEFIAVYIGIKEMFLDFKLINELPKLIATSLN